MRVLPPFPPELSARTASSLARLGVQVLTKALVTEIKADSVSIRVGERTELVPTRTVLWAAGVAASMIAKKGCATRDLDIKALQKHLVENAQALLDDLSNLDPARRAVLEQNIGNPAVAVVPPRRVI